MLNGTELSAFQRCVVPPSSVSCSPLFLDAWSWRWRHYTTPKYQ